MAERDFDEGDLIFEENALAVGPNPESTLQCILCSKKLATEEKSYCPVCGYAKCQDCLGHPDLEECKVLSALDHQESIKKAPEATTRQLPNSIYEPILPLRLLLTKWYTH